MAFVLREIRRDEAKTLEKEAKACFSFFERLGVDRPECGIVAEEDGKLCGGAFLKIVEPSKEKRIGYFDVGFVCPAYRGSGVADMVYKSAVAWLKEKGCGCVTAMVIDENMKSKIRIEAAGLHESSFSDVASYAGWIGCAKLCLKFFAAMLMGTNCKLYSDLPKRERSEGGAFAFMLVFNLLALGLGKLLSQGISRALEAILGAAFILALSSLGSYIGSRIADGKWRYQVPAGGAGLSFGLQLIGTFYPWMGRMYPIKYEKSPECAKALGICALIEWIFVLAASIGCLLLMRFHPALEMAAVYASVFLLYRCIPCFPFSTMGTKRVWEWNKALCIVLMLLSFGVFAFAWMH